MAVATSEERKRIARAGFEAFNAGDPHAVIALLAENVEVFASPELANAGRFHGHDGYSRWVQPWIDAWEDLEMGVTDVTPVGDRHVVAGIHQTGRGRAGIEVSMDVAFVFDVRGDGLISYLALVPDREQGLALARDREGSG